MKSGKLEEEARKLRAEDVRMIVANLKAAARDHEADAEDAPPAIEARSFWRRSVGCRPMEADVPKPPVPQVRYVERLVSEPGHFPPQFVKVAVP